MTEGGKKTSKTGTEEGQVGAAENRAKGCEPVEKSGQEVCDRKPGKGTERTQIPDRRGRQSWEREALSGLPGAGERGEGRGAPAGRLQGGPAPCLRT